MSDRGTIRGGLAASRPCGLLFTHCVEDVSELCTGMAIIQEGRILLERNRCAVEELEAASGVVLS